MGALEILHFCQHWAEMFGMQPALAPRAIRHFRRHAQGGLLQTGKHFLLPWLTKLARINRDAGGNQRQLDVIGFKQLDRKPPQGVDRLLHTL